jgi:chemotaxis signal transduction protein/nucleoid-associated protein YgaU
MTESYLLFSIGTTTWGVGDQDITAVTAARPLHRLPLSPPSVAGMALIEDKPVTVFDLGACLGAPPLAGPEKGSFLLINREGRTTAFAVAGKVDRIDGAADRVVPLPHPARSAVVESCLVRGSSIVLIIKLKRLLEQVKQGDLDIPTPLPPDASERRERPVPSSVLVMSLGGDRFCIDAADTAYGERGAAEITPLPYARQLAGIIAQGQDIVPVMSLAARIGLENRRAGGGMIITELDGMRCGLPVDGEEGRRESVTVLELPPLARPLWSRRAIVEDGKVIPLIDRQAVASASPETRDEDYFAGQYHAASAFPLRFRKGGVEVTELSLFGARHAVPKDEVAEVLPLLPVRRLTQVPEIVMGVSELNGRLLPVLDLEAIFGRRSRVTQEWKMLRVVNGDFDALVVIETVFGGKELSPDMQRQVPIAIPHQVLYGCYLDSSAVRLILNVEALAVHFEKTGIRELITGMSPAVPMELEEPQRERVWAPAAAEPPAQEDATSQAPTAEQPVPAEMQVAGDTYRYSGGAAAPRWRVPRVDQESAAKAREVAAEAERRRIGEEATKRAEVEARERAEAEARVQAEGEARRRLMEEERQRIEEEEKNRREREAHDRAEAEAKERAEHARKRQAEEERRRIEEETRTRAEAETRERAEADARARSEEEARQRAVEAEQRRLQAEAADELRAEERLREAVNGELRTRAAAQDKAAVPWSSAEHREAERMKWMLPVAAALVVLALAGLLLYITGKTPVPVKEVAVSTSGPIAPKAGAIKEPEPPLYLNVPRSMPKPETVVYVVVKGDTLWGIAKRFTGDPFNYPRVARDNSIATPDLIFPGQKIKLIRKER